MVVLVAVVVLKELGLEQLPERVLLDKDRLAVLVPPLLMAAGVAGVLEALVLLEPVGHPEALPELGLAMVGWVSKAQSTALQRLMVAAVELGQLGRPILMPFIAFQVMAGRAIQPKHLAARSIARAQRLT
jgi:hypothetical protein